MARKVTKVESAGCYVSVRFDDHTGSTFLMGDDDAATMLAERIVEIAVGGLAPEAMPRLSESERVERYLEGFDEAVRLIAEGRKWVSEAVQQMIIAAAELEEDNPDQMKLPGVNAERRCPECGKTWRTDASNLHPDSCPACGWKKPVLTAEQVEGPGEPIFNVESEDEGAMPEQCQAVKLGEGWPPKYAKRCELDTGHEGEHVLADQELELTAPRCPTCDGEATQGQGEGKFQRYQCGNGHKWTEPRLTAVVMETDPATGKLILDEHTQVDPEGLDLEAYKQKVDGLIDKAEAHKPDLQRYLNGGVTQGEAYNTVGEYEQLKALSEGRPYPMELEVEEWCDIAGRGTIAVVIEPELNALKPGMDVKLEGEVYGIRNIERMGRSKRVGLLVKVPIPAENRSIDGKELCQRSIGREVMMREHLPSPGRRMAVNEALVTYPEVVARLEAGWLPTAHVKGEQRPMDTPIGPKDRLEVEWRKARDNPQAKTRGVPENHPIPTTETEGREEEARPKVERCPGSGQPATKRRGGAATTAICPGCHRDIATKPVASMLVPVLVEHNRDAP
jgi:hypothetical protein